MMEKKLCYKEATLEIYSKSLELPTAFHESIIRNLSDSSYCCEKCGLCLQILLEALQRDSWCHSIIIFNDKNLTFKNETAMNLMQAAGDFAQNFCKSAKKTVILPFCSPGGMLRAHWIIHIESIEQKC